MSHTAHYLHMFYIGNPSAFWFIVTCIAFAVVVVCVTPLCDEEFDKYMAQYEEDLALDEDSRRAA